MGAKNAGKILKLVGKVSDMYKNAGNLGVARIPFAEGLLKRAPGGGGASPRGGGKRPLSALTDENFAKEIARRAERRVGGSGSVAGTKKHSYAEKLMKRYQKSTGQRTHLEVEESYWAGQRVSRGESGSARPDLYDPNTGNVYDYKFTNQPGNGLCAGQVAHNANNLPVVGAQVEINP